MLGSVRTVHMRPSQVATKMQQDVDARYYELNKYKMLHPRTVAEKIADMIFNENKYQNGISVDLPN